MSIKYAEITIARNLQEETWLAYFKNLIGDEDIITKINGINDVSINSFTYYKYEDFSIFRDEIILFLIEIQENFKI